MKIGVFDSGVGGLSVANAIKKSFPKHQVLLRQDKANLPYGTKPPGLLKQLVLPFLIDLQKQGCSVIVVACNTVTTTVISDLRSAIDITLVGIEPMIKPAGLMTKSRIIAVCATPATLNSQRYADLKSQYAKDITVLEPDCSDWAHMIENNQSDHENIRQRITEVCEQGADVIVLGCTHYHWIEQYIKDIAAIYQAAVIQPEQAVLAQLKTVMKQCA
ncbi:glutamate racemase [soil metagenome]